MARTRIDRWSGKPRQPRATPSPQTPDLSTQYEYREPVVGERFHMNSEEFERVVVRVSNGYVSHSPINGDGEYGPMQTHPGSVIYSWIKWTRTRYPETAPIIAQRSAPADPMIQAELVAP